MTRPVSGAGIFVLAASGSLEHLMIMLLTIGRIDYDYRRSTVGDLRERRYTVFNTFYAGLPVTGNLKTVLPDFP